MRTSQSDLPYPRGLPAWPARNESDNVDMLRWLREQLWHQDCAVMTAALNPPYDALRTKTAPFERLSWELDEAELGNVGPLRAALVKLAGDARIERFIHRPKLPRGKKWPRRRASMMQETIDTARRIRKIWDEHYGPGQRRASDGWTTAEFTAAIYLEIEERESYPDNGEPRLADIIEDHLRRGQ